jgi:hypothetical protein
MITEYTIEEIKKILTKIEKLKEKKHIEKVKEIIFKENPNLSTTKKSSGVLLFFHNLSQSTYKKLDIFFNKLEKEKMNILSATLSENYEKTLSEISDLCEPKVKLSNAEKKIIKKKNYHKQIEEKSDDIYVSDDDVFLNKNS